MSTGSTAGDTHATLLHDLYTLLRQPLHPPLDDAAFNTIALRVFEHQYRNNSPYRAYCDRRQRTPDRVDHWTGVPVVPTAAFQTLPLLAGDVAAAQVVFRTSGTTAGRERRGVRYMIELGLYNTASLSFFRACVLPDGAELPMLALVPPARELPESSLAHMIELVCARLGANGSGHFADVDRGLHVDALIQHLRDAENRGQPVCLLGTSLSFVHLLDAMQRLALRVRLPAGSRLMDTGGTKGATRTFDAAELRARYGDVLGLEPTHCVNEYGMTELCSQFYDDSLLNVAHSGADGVRKVAPRWVRSRVVHPETLEPVPAGETGILQHFDAASYDAVMAVQTEDLARQVPGGFVLLGREPGSPPRGCSIAMDEMLNAARQASRA